MKWLVAGILFAALWASAATATKIGLTVAQPLVIAVIRFGLGAVIMLFIAHGIKRFRLPQRTEWKQIASTAGLLILLFSMLSYSVGAIYFSAKKWNGLSLFTINGWQTLLGGIFLLPFTLFFYDGNANHYDETFWWSVAWLAIPVSIAAVQLWLWLLQVNAVKAGLWLFLCPIFGFAFAAWLTNDVISMYTVTGVILVIIGLLLSKINTKKNEVVFD